MKHIYLLLINLSYKHLNIIYRFQFQDNVYNIYHQCFSSKLSFNLWLIWLNCYKLMNLSMRISCYQFSLKLKPYFILNMIHKHTCYCYKHFLKLFKHLVYKLSYHIYRHISISWLSSYKHIMLDIQLSIMNHLQQQIN